MSKLILRSTVSTYLHEPIEISRNNTHVLSRSPSWKTVANKLICMRHKKTNDDIGVV